MCRFLQGTNFIQLGKASEFTILLLGERQIDAYRHFRLRGNDVASIAGEFESDIKHLKETFYSQN